MTLPDPSPVRKPPNRFWLYAPFVLLIVVALAWGVGWKLIERQGFAAMDRQAAALRQQGWQVGWSRRTLSGWPFRFELDLYDLKLVGPSGRGVSSPLIRAEAYVYDTDKWIAFAPGEIALERPGGTVTVQGRVLRAGLTGLKRQMRSLTLEGRDLTFTPQSGASPLAYTGATRLIVSLREGPNDQGAVLIDAGGLKTSPGGLVAELSAGQPTDLGLELIASHRSALRGHDWPAAVQAWRAAGGQATIQKAQISTPADALVGHGGSLSVNAAGEIEGRIPIDTAASRGLGAYVGMIGDPALTLGDGQAKLGGQPVAPSPRLY